MGLRYDFDIVTPEDGAPTAHFRDERTVEAICKADPKVRTYFEASGFEMTTHDSGAGENRYLARDETARIEVIERLGDNLWKYGVTNVDMAEFDFGAFMAHLSEAEPVQTHDAFEIGLPVQRLFQTFRRRRPTRILG